MRGVIALLAAGLLVLTGLAQGPTSKEPKKAVPDFQREIVPIFEAKCFRCHGIKKKDGRLDMRSVAALLRGGNSGPALVPGDAEKSLLVELIHFNEMPPRKEKDPVSKADLARIRAWIDAGAAESKK